MRLPGGAWIVKSHSSASMTTFVLASRSAGSFTFFTEGTQPERLQRIRYSPAGSPSKTSSPVSEVCVATLVK